MNIYKSTKQFPDMKQEDFFFCFACFLPFTGCRRQSGKPVLNEGQTRHHGARMGT